MSLLRILFICQMQNGVTPLHVASHYDHQNVALLLLDKGASPHAMAKNGHTPLHIAARKNQVRVILIIGIERAMATGKGYYIIYICDRWTSQLLC